MTTQWTEPARMTDRQIDAEWRAIGACKLHLRKTKPLWKVLGDIRKLNSRLDLLVSEMMLRQKTAYRQAMVNG